MSRSGDRPVDLYQLDIFLTIASTGSMSGAASVLGVSQPAVSQALAIAGTDAGGPFAAAACAHVGRRVHVTQRGTADRDGPSIEGSRD
ncbi:helix-turn-helix domain-containing protein [Paraburkholderia hospita]|uniref:helix-turn-helix domain-containing protein n=1 Tax=Paraburkholderia hospita TaxID=169430 RepID=UPI0009A6B6EE